MAKIGEFIYPWGGGHYARMMRLDGALGGGHEIHYASKGHVYEKLLERFPGGGDRIHEVLMPTPVDGRSGPSVALSLANLLLPVAGNPPLVRQVAGYLRQERRIYDRERFDLVINDGDMGSNVLAKNRGIPSLFVTNQFRPRLYGTRAYLYPPLVFVSRQIEKATRILVADSPPPNTLCEYNLNLTPEAERKTEYVGHFAGPEPAPAERTDLERLVEGSDFGYWMRTGDRPTNEGTGRRYEEAFRLGGMGRERRVVSHARADPGIDCVTGADGRRYGISEALDRKVDWLQIDVGYLTERERHTVVDGCRYAVSNGSHTVMGELLGRGRPVIGMPVYDEHTNNVRWAEERGLGVLARGPAQAAAAVARIRRDYARFEEALAGFAAGFARDGAENAARAAREALEAKR